MKDLIMSWRKCLLVFVACAVVVLFQKIFDGSIESGRKVGEGSCTAQALVLAAGKDDAFYNSIRPDGVVLTLDCTGSRYITQQSEVIVAWREQKTSAFQCIQYANSVAKCSVSPQSAAAK